jgi:hypothetical protein
MFTFRQHCRPKEWEIVGVGLISRPGDSDAKQMFWKPVGKHINDHINLHTFEGKRALLMITTGKRVQNGTVPGKSDAWLLCMYCTRIPILHCYSSDTQYIHIISNSKFQIMVHHVKEVPCIDKMSFKHSRQTPKSSSCTKLWSAMRTVLIKK